MFSWSEMEFLEVSNQRYWTSKSLTSGFENIINFEK